MISIPQVIKIELPSAAVTINSKFAISVQVEEIEGDVLRNYANDFYSNELTGE